MPVTIPCFSPTATNRTISHYLDLNYPLLSSADLNKGQSGMAKNNPIPHVGNQYALHKRYGVSRKIVTTNQSAGRDNETISAIQQRRRPTPTHSARQWPATCRSNHHRPPCLQFGTKRLWVQIPPPRHHFSSQSPDSERRNPPHRFDHDLTIGLSVAPKLRRVCQVAGRAQVSGWPWPNTRRRRARVSAKSCCACMPLSSLPRVMASPLTETRVSGWS